MTRTIKWIWGLLATTSGLMLANKENSRLLTVDLTKFINRSTLRLIFTIRFICITKSR